MKKSVIALSITAAVTGLGFVSGAHAMSGVLSGSADGNTAATALALNGDGVGHILLVPYFTAQGDNSTLINLVNTDTVNGKAVKVRFRGAANSDDIYDFQVFMSPGDVWTANVAKGADGRAQLTTTDASCTKPAKSVLNTTPFVISRLDSTLTTAQNANVTREGYVEIFNMGDIPKAFATAASEAHPAQPTGTNFAGTDAGTADGVNDLYFAIKHVAKVAPCSGTAWTALDTTNLATTAAAEAAGLLPPSTGLMANWTVINVISAASWSGEATAIQAVDGTGAPVLGNVVYWPQTGDAATGVNFYTADPLLRTAHVAKYDASAAAYAMDTTAPVTAGFYDLPDLSTPYVSIGAVNTNPLDQARALTASIAASSVTNEFLTDSAIVASTDWVFSQPTRRYSVAFDYSATISASDDGRRFSDIVDKANLITGYTAGYFLQANTLVSSDTNGNGRQICTKNISVTPFDREETGTTTSTTVVVSPSTPADPLSFCGEATVLSINNGGILATGTKALTASVAVKDLDVTFVDGWMKLGTPSATTVVGVDGLPMVGAAFVRANSATQSFGATYNHRMGR